MRSAAISTAVLALGAIAAFGEAPPALPEPYHMPSASNAGPNEEPPLQGQQPGPPKQTVVPGIVLQAHVAVFDSRSYTAKQIPAKFQGGAFLAFHGSWNRAGRVGYPVAFVPFNNGKPAGPVDDFLAGFMLDPTKRKVWGRPAGLLQLADGSLLVSGGGNRLWRI